jgi:hypothetical protein
MNEHCSTLDCDNKAVAAGKCGLCLSNELVGKSVKWDSGRMSGCVIAILGTGIAIVRIAPSGSTREYEVVRVDAISTIGEECRDAPL